MQIEIKWGVLRDDNMKGIATAPVEIFVKWQSEQRETFITGSYAATDGEL